MGLPFSMTSVSLGSLLSITLIATNSFANHSTVNHETVNPSAENYTTMNYDAATLANAPFPSEHSGADLGLEGYTHHLFDLKRQDPVNYSAATEILRLQNSRSICGSKNNLQYINIYKPGLKGPSEKFVQAYQPTVGAMARNNNPHAKNKYCSGTLIAENLFLTASHCVGSDTKLHYVVFNYETEQGKASPLKTQDFYRIRGIIEDGLNDLDFAILKLEGRPGLTYGYTDISATPLKLQQKITIIQHPKGEPKQIDFGNVSRLAKKSDYMIYNNLDTEPGSSGSGILNDKGFLVGVHTNGGCGKASAIFANGNAGVKMTHIVEASTTIQSLIMNTEFIH